LLDSSNGTSNCLVNTNSVALAGTYYAVIRDASGDDGFGSDIDVEAGEYSFTFARIPDTQLIDPDSGPLTNGAARAGAVSFGDLDVYTFPVTAGVGFTFNLAETATSGFDPTFTLYNPSGTVVTTQSGAASATFTVTNPNAVTGTYTALVYDGSAEESGPYSIALNTAAGTDTFAPRVHDAQYRFDQSPPDLRVIFSEHVGASFLPSDVEIIDLATNQPVDNGLLSFTYDAVNDQFRVTFPALPGRVLPDGNYRLHVDAADLTDPAGNPLDADLNHDFFVLAGDANRDRRVTLQDFNIMAGNFGKSNRVFSRGDFNYDGIVTLPDFNILAGNFGKMVAPASTSASPFSQRMIGVGDDRDDDLSAILA
jgi:hypothetical protein